MDGGASTVPLVKSITKVLLHNLRCSCKHYKEGPCSKQFTTTQIVEQRQQMFQLSAGEKDMLLLGVRMYNTITDNSTMLSTWKKGPKGKAERQHQRSHYMVGNKKACAGTPSNSSMSKYSGLANNHCSIAGGG